MSLTSIYYVCSDGNTYRDPTWRTADGTAFVCTDDEDPPELVVVKPKGVTPTLAQQLAEQAFAEMGIQATLVLHSYYGGMSRCFGDIWSVKCIKPAFRYFIRFTTTPPPPTKHRGVLDTLEELE